MQLKIILFFSAAVFGDTVSPEWDKWSPLERNGNLNVTYRQVTLENHRFEKKRFDFRK